MLSYINDKLSPHEFDDIVKDDFAALRQMLERRRWMIGQGEAAPSLILVIPAGGRIKIG